jgi:nitrate/nitrite-specific signal transduction histidine kinase
MKRMSKRNEKELLETFRLALQNVSTQKEIADLMSEFSYDETVIDWKNRSP